MKITFLFLLLINGLVFLWQAYFVVPQKPTAAQLPTNVPQLVLLEETGTTVQVTTTIAAPTAVEVPAVVEVAPPQDEDVMSTTTTELPHNPLPAAPQNCYTVGPFVDDTILKKAKRLFTGNHITYQQRTLSKPEVFGYNVFLAPFPSREKALAMIDTLTVKGIKDYYVMPGPELENAISLGLFSEQRFALSHMQFLKSKGGSAKIRTRYNERKRHWLDYIQTGNTIDKAALIRLSPQGDIQRLLRACD